MILLHGFSLGNYRSYREPQYLSPLTHLSIVAGRNNSGKSNAVRFLQRFVGTSEEVQSQFDVPADEPEGTEHNFAIAIELSRLLELVAARIRSPDPGAEFSTKAFFGHERFRRNSPDLAWIQFTTSRNDPYGNNAKRVVLLSDEQISSVASNEDVGQAASRLSLEIAGISGAAETDVGRVLHQLAVTDLLPPIVMVDAVRQVDPVNETTDLVTTINSWRDPLPGRDAAKLEEKYRLLNALVGDVLNDHSAEVKTPAASSLAVRTNTRYLDLEYLGTGLHQLIAIAVSAIRVDDSVVCIEEPEVHMHPSMQRRLLRFLSQHASNQYIITTHSAALLDSRNASIFEAQLHNNGDTTLEHVTEPNHLAELSASLGYRASDLVQANFVVWVEGPSDRIYLNCWLSLVAPELIEGVHYSIMFYGGSLLRHLKGDDYSDVEADVVEFVQLCRINRNFSVVIDSDLKREKQELSDAKKIIQAQIESQPRASIWITDGYTIENYIPKELLKKAVETCFKGRQSSWDGSQRSNPLVKFPRGKVRVAREVTRQWDESTPMSDQLLEKLKALALAIALAQGDHL